MYPHFFIVKEASLDSVATSMQGACKNTVCMSFLSCGFKVSAYTGFSENSLACYCTCRFNEYLALHRPSSTCGGLLEMYRGINIAQGFSAFETFFRNTFGVLKVLLGDLQNSRACSPIIDCYWMGPVLHTSHSIVKSRDPQSPSMASRGNKP